MKLIIVESPAKIRTIQGFLGGEYKLAASMGHIYRIIPKDSSIDIKNNYEPTYEVIPEKTKVVSELKLTAKKAEIIYIASDPDREGEAIGYDILHRVLKDVKCPIKRITFNSITKSAVLAALKNPRDIDLNLYHAQQARSVLDMLVGFRVSRVLFSKIMRGLSAGRVQSIGLELIVNRQKEIDAFIKEEYWDIVGKFQTKDHKSFTAMYNSKEKLTNGEQTKKIAADIEKEPKWEIESINKDTKSRSPTPLFHTSSLQQFCYSAWGWDNKKTMSVAQKLYEGFPVGNNPSTGLISYMRTDSFNIDPESLKNVRDMIQNKYGSTYISSTPRYYKSKNKAEQSGHTGILCPHLDYTPSIVKTSIPVDEAKLYEAIYNRFVACQMSDATFDTSKVTIKSGSAKHIFTANGQTMKFDGYLKVWIYSTAKEEVLPVLKEKEEVFLESLDPQQHWTQGPPRMNPASLTKEMEASGVGRPSTYVSVIETIKKRQYAEIVDKAFVPTDLGKKVCAFLIPNFPELMDVEYTARIEDQLDDCAEGKIVWYKVVDEFYKELKKRLVASKDAPSMRTNEATTILCPTCGKYNLVKKNGRYGNFYGCAGYADKKKCKATFKIGPDGQPIIAPVVEKVYLEGVKCDKCGKKIVARKSKRTGKEFYACSGFPKCKRLFDAGGNHLEFKKKFYNKKTNQNA
jgi:DNA topoisomerase-1